MLFAEAMVAGEGWVERCVPPPMRLMGRGLEYLYFLIDVGPDDESEMEWGVRISLESLVAGVA